MKLAALDHSPIHSSDCTMNLLTQTFRKFDHAMARIHTRLLFARMLETENDLNDQIDPGQVIGHLSEFNSWCLLASTNDP